MIANNKEQTLEYMLTLIDSKDKKIAQKTTEYFGISKSSVYNYLTELEKSGAIEKIDGEYALVYKQFDFTYTNDGHLREERVFNADLSPIFSDMPKNVQSIWRYSFTEMMNNAIEHSSSDTITVRVKRCRLKTQVTISDNGIGIFKNIGNFVKQQTSEEITPEECASMLFAGKFTTAKSMHSGEGIFFTSHMMDRFVIVSEKIVFTRNNFCDESLKVLNPRTNGTTVYMELFNNSKKTTSEIFGRYATVDEGFTKTNIPIAHFFPYGNPVSRSEARRLGELILKFEEIELDFRDVDEVGQAFVHELFVLWQANNPGKRLLVLNAGDDVNFMIKRVLNTKNDA